MADTSPGRSSVQHVVVVDDQEISLRFLRNTLADLPGVEVHPFLSSAEALAWCADNDVDCFLIDYHMPAPDGIEMLRRLRAMPAFVDVPIIILTGEHERQLRYRALDAGATDYVEKPFDRRELLARLTTMLALRAAQRRLLMQVGWLEASLLDSEERSREHAERLEALSRLANNPEIGDEAMIPAMLCRAVASIRPDQRFFALLRHVEGEDLVTEAVAGSAPCALQVGARQILERTTVAQSIRRGRTQSWDDLATDPQAPPDPRALGWRAVITTHFAVGAETHALTFASKDAVTKPFRAQDHTYVEVVAQFFATLLQEQWQAAKIRHQLEHDSLTGLLNRRRFRSLGRSAVRAGQPAAVAVFDLVDFHLINESHGHLTGDAILVEAAAALAREVRDEEILARVGGDSFAVCFSQFAEPEALRSRIAQLAAVFDTPLSTGDRTGTEVVQAAAVVGIGIGPDDGTTLDELLLRAEAHARGGSAPPRSNRGEDD